MAIVFAAGFLVPQRLAGKDYFRGAAAAFPGALFPKVSLAGEIRTRAAELAGLINTAFRQGPIHIVAHSMAGLDARFVLSHNLNGLANPGRVASLSTISTPHWGSPVADLLVGAKPSRLDPRRIAYDSLVALAAELGLQLGGLGNLTSSYTAEVFNPQNRNVSHVSYHCYAGSETESFLLKPSHEYVDLTGQDPEEKVNDGLVSVKSAAWVPLAEKPWPTDHLGELGYSLSSSTLESAFDHIAAYRRILARAGA